MIRSTYTHQEHSMEHKPFTREDFEDGTVDKYYADRKADEEKQKNTFENSLSDLDTLQEIRENGTQEEKLKAFDYLAKNKIEKPTKTEPTKPTKTRPSDSKDRVPMRTRLLPEYK